MSWKESNWVFEKQIGQKLCNVVDKITYLIMLSNTEAYGQVCCLLCIRMYLPKDSSDRYRVKSTSENSKDSRAEGLKKVFFL